MKKTLIVELDQTPILQEIAASLSIDTAISEFTEKEIEEFIERNWEDYLDLADLMGADMDETMSLIDPSDIAIRYDHDTILEEIGRENVAQWLMGNK